MAKEIGWFKKKQKPVRNGSYRTRSRCLGEGFSYFKDGFWGSQRFTAEGAALDFAAYRNRGAAQDKEWCGLAERAQ